jgi:hypothetical protein
MPAATRILCFRTSSLTPQASRLPSMSTAYPHRFRSGRVCPAPRRPDELTPNPLPLPLHLLSFAWRPRHGLQPFGHPCRATRLDSLDLSFVLSHRRGYSPPRSDEKKGDLRKELPPKVAHARSLKTVVGCSVSGSPLASLRFGPPYAPATRPFFNLPFQPDASSSTRSSVLPSCRDCPVRSERRGMWGLSTHPPRSPSRTWSLRPRCDPF